MSDLFTATPEAADFEERAVRPARELGAYEALWCESGASFKSIADKFRQHPNAIPSDFVSSGDAEHYSRLALGTIRAARIQHFGIRVFGAGEYPPRLRDAQNPLQLLYFQGNWDISSTRCVAVVGTRKPSPEGERRTAKLVRGFVEEGFTVVSGLAAGIDTAAHTAAIEAGGRTIAVLGTPISATYPPQNAELQKRIADDFLVISQVPIVRYSRQIWKSNRLFFPERNVTMSALTEATVIVEAGETSGTLVQARHALQQGRKLFILDSCFKNPQISWPSRFLERGAIRVTDFGDIKATLDSVAPHGD